MSKKKDKKKENLLAETVEMQKKQAMNLVAQSTVNQQQQNSFDKCHQVDYSTLLVYELFRLRLVNNQNCFRSMLFHSFLFLSI